MSSISISELIEEQVDDEQLYKVMLDDERVVISVEIRPSLLPWIEKYKDKVWDRDALTLLTSQVVDKAVVEMLTREVPDGWNDGGHEPTAAVVTPAPEQVILGSGGSAAYSVLSSGTTQLAN